ncbi:hypothetical protein BH09MYX1_BH09MYX1_16380 [soil metagenome]
MSSDRSTLAAASDPMPSLEAKAKIANRYEVLGLLGVGGMGSVYRVRDLELDEIVALKMLKRELASPQHTERFRREVKLARRVTHKNVARTFDLGEHEGERFLTMELVEGESLATVLSREGKLPLMRIADLVGPICEGLGAAHAVGVVHRDFKPDNVMLATDGRVVLTDFGIARAAGGGEAQRTQIPLGTPAYMAPEQVEAGTVDERADLYALGAVLFEMMTGRLPWEGESVYAVAAMRLIHPPPDPRVHRPELPSAVAELVMRCMARKPQDRPSSAAEVATRFVNVTLPADADALSLSIRVQPITHRTEPGQKTVAVIPFRNMGVPDDEYLADGITDDLIDSLSMTDGLRVRPRGVVMGHKQGADPRSIGRDLDVQVVVDGSVRITADALRVTARLLSVADGFQLWARRFDGARADVLKISDEVARAVAGALMVAQRPERAQMTDPMALDLYLRGRHEFFKMWADATERAVDLLRQAHALAPDDPVILAGYSLALARRFGIAQAGDDRVVEAKRLALRALELAPTSAEAHAARASVAMQENDVAKAGRLVREALELSPLLVDAHEQSARLLSETNAPVDAIVQIEHAMHLEPRLSNLRYVKARVQALIGDWDEVERVFAARPTDLDDANLYWMSRVRMAVWTRDHALTTRVLGELDSVPPFAFKSLVRGLGFVLLTGGIPEAARSFLDDRAAADITPRASSFFRQLQAETLALAGDTDAVIADVSKATDAGLFDILWFDRCRLLDEVRKDPRFAALRPRIEERAASITIALLGRRVKAAG